MKNKYKAVVEEMQKHKYTTFFFLCYLLFSVVLLGLNLVTTKLNNFVGIVFSIILVIAYVFIKKKKIKINFNKGAMITLIVIPLLIRLSLLFLEYGNIDGDYAAFLNNAIQYAHGEALNNRYISLFPFLYPYIALLGTLFKIFGNNYIICVFMNLVFELVGVLFFYLILKNKYGKGLALKGLIFSLYNPFSILWISKCCPVIVVNTMITISIYAISKVNFNKSNFWIWSLIAGILIGLTNAFRPFMIIFIIALVIYYVSEIINKTSWKKLLSSLVIIILSYLVVNSVVMFFTEKKIGIDLEGSQSGFSMYVGSNYQGHGMWNLEDAEYFSEVVEKLGNIEGHHEMTRLAIERYKSYGVKNIWFMGYKAAMLGRNLDNYTFMDVFYSITNKIPEWVCILIKVYLSTYLYLLLVINVYSAWNLFNKQNKIDALNYVAIFGMGLFVASLLLEVSPRYFMPCLVPIMITCCMRFQSSD